MVWVWRDDDEDEGLKDVNPRSDGGDRCSNQRIVKFDCRTEEVEPGRFVRKCEKTEQILRSCVGRTVEVVKSETEFTEEDVTNGITRGPLPLVDTPASEPFSFPGLRSDIDAIEKSISGGFSNFFEVAEEMMSGFSRLFGAPHFSERKSSPPFRRQIPIDGQQERDALRRGRNDLSDYSELDGEVTDV
ncbi:hypothetical protein Sjap_012566 [Stephania japonica]|uniref:Mal d 1-associated protein n=1 Tax=Stephania japonica TaxID=461633 RepID=A0AAP0NYD5_9MAGN